jgi:hypothetical protein
MTLENIRTLYLVRYLMDSKLASSLISGDCSGLNKKEKLRGKVELMNDN